MENNQKEAIQKIYSDYEFEIVKLVKLKEKYKEVIARHISHMAGDFDSEDILECCNDGLKRLRNELNKKIIAYYDFHNNYLESKYDFVIKTKDYSKHLWFGTLKNNSLNAYG
jgi:hypothetical protein